MTKERDKELLEAFSSHIEEVTGVIRVKGFIDSFLASRPEEKEEKIRDEKSPRYCIAPNDHYQHCMDSHDRLCTHCEYWKSL
jgi:hypothetical protein